MLHSKVKVFDLDDTLYSEFSFVESGFRAVSKHLSPDLKLSAEKIFSDLMALLEGNKRGNTFDLLLTNYEVFSREKVKELVQVYRRHEPVIKLDKKIKNFLGKMRNERLYLVTDGHKLVQQKKIESLGISNYFSKIFITNLYGVSKQKPSLYCFNKILKIEDVSYDKLVYVGDNPVKDFVNLNKVGAFTVQSLMYVRDLPELPLNYYAQYRIHSADELFDLFV
jgi:putative hydrolase of the HAD superfamily